MTETRTESILQRFPKILAVTAASYGIDLQARASQPSGDAHRHRRQQQRRREMAGVKR